MAVTMLMAQKADRAMKHDHGKMQMQQGGMHPMAACMEELKLTDAQKMKFHEARAAFQKQENTLTAEIKNLRLDIAEAMKAENIKRVKELNQQISAKELQLKKRPRGYDGRSHERTHQRAKRNHEKNTCP
ncbi:MAG: hypothetical protein LRZ88_11340 [Candidatus Cloacimonetes bacterium]|nr:hypothetical protein [Candidatus Cloacimonadota bacterium]